MKNLVQLSTSMKKRERELVTDMKIEELIN
jgi:hypothetical protein